MRASALGVAAMIAATALTAPVAARDRDFRDRDGRDRDAFVITPNQIVDMADARIAQFKADLRLNPDQDRNWGGLQNAMHDMAQRRADRMAKMREQRSAAAPDTTAPVAASPPANVDPNARPAGTSAASVATDPNARPLDARDRDSRARDDRDRDARIRDDRDRSAPDAIAEMRRQADALAARADDTRKFADAAGPLYGSLDDGQKRRFIAFVQRNLWDEPDGPAYRR